MRKKVVKAKNITKKSKKNLHCTICNKSGFTSSFKLKSHLFLHKAIPARHKCSFCPKEYYRSDEFSRHLSTHTKTKKLCYCDHCGRGFVDKRNLITHLTIHDDLPPALRYTCTTCGANYCEQRLLKYHTLKEHLHTTVPLHLSKNLNETWIERVKDTKDFVKITKVKHNTLVIKKTDLKNAKLDESMFQQHIASVFAMKETYYSKAICDYCGKEMLKKSILPHIRERHLKVKRFVCEICDKKFNRHYQLCLHKCGQDRRRRVKVEKVEK